MAEQKIRLPGSSYEELQKIILAYSHISGKASNTDISKRAALHPTIVSRNGGFLVECGILESGQKKQITAIGTKLSQAIEHKIEDQVEMTWLDIFEEVPFFDTVLSAVRIRGGMDQNTLKSHIAYTAGQKKSPMTMTGAQTVIDILRASGSLVEDDGRLTVIDPAMKPRESDVVSAPPVDMVPTKTLAVASGSHTSPVTIQIQIQVTPDDLDGLGEKLRAVLEELSRDIDSDTD